MTAISFAAISAVLIISALAVVLTEDLIRAVYWLALALLATAALYVTLDAGFLAGVQVLTYVGGVVTLMIFGVMVTRRHDGSPIPAGAQGRFRAAVVALVAFSAMASAIVESHLDDVAPAETHVSVQALARALLDRHLLAFEAASVLLLAAIVGAVVLARRSDAQMVAVARGSGGLPARLRILGQGAPAALAPKVGATSEAARVTPAPPAAGEGHS